MEALPILFGSSVRVKLLRFFLLNELVAFDSTQLVRKTQEKLPEITRELSVLEKSGIIRSKPMIRDIEVQSKKTVVIPTTNKKPKKGQKKQPVRTKTVTTVKTVTKKVPTWTLNTQSTLVPSLKSLVLDSELFTTKDMARDIAKTGVVKLLIVSGIFVKNGSDKVDMVIVGDKMDEKQFDKTIARLESQIGKELRYSLFSPDDFLYRMNMFDKYLGSILASPHEKLIQKIEIPRP